MKKLFLILFCIFGTNSAFTMRRNETKNDLFVSIANGRNSCSPANPTPVSGLWSPIGSPTIQFRATTPLLAAVKKLDTVTITKLTAEPAADLFDECGREVIGLATKQAGELGTPMKTTMRDLVVAQFSSIPGNFEVASTAIRAGFLTEAQRLAKHAKAEYILVQLKTAQRKLDEDGYTKCYGEYLPDLNIAADVAMDRE
jgi:hypothetical protein